MHQVSFLQESAKENELKNVSLHMTQIFIAVKDHISTRCSLESSKKPSSSDSCVVKGCIQWDVLRGQTLLLLLEIQPLLPCEMRGYAMHVSEKLKMGLCVYKSKSHHCTHIHSFGMGEINFLSCSQAPLSDLGLAVCEGPGSREGKMPKEKLSLMGFLMTGFPVSAPAAGLSQALRTDCWCTQ